MAAHRRRKGYKKAKRSKDVGRYKKRSKQDAIQDVEIDTRKPAIQSETTICGIAPMVSTCNGFRSESTIKPLQVETTRGAMSVKDLHGRPRREAKAGPGGWQRA